MLSIRGPRQSTKLSICHLQLAFKDISERVDASTVATERKGLGFNEGQGSLTRA